MNEVGCSNCNLSGYPIGPDVWDECKIPEEKRKDCQFYDHTESEEEPQTGEKP